MLSRTACHLFLTNRGTGENAEAPSTIITKEMTFIIFSNAIRAELTQN